MITSMTGFGRGTAESQGVRVQVELQSVNSRFCDIQVRAPASLQRLEAEIREWLQARISRGKIAVQVDWKEGGASGELPVLDEGVAKRYLQELARLASLAGLEERPDWSCLVRLPGLFRMESTTLGPEAVQKLVMQALALALEDLLRMRAAEGAVLERDLRERLERIEAHLRRIEELAAGAKDRIRVRLREKVEALLQPGEVDEERLALEVVLIAERSDIAEELVRFHSHNAQFLETLAQGGEVGRRLNFLLQEMNREANTINAKAGEAEILHLVVEIKEEVERLREQVQNLA